MEIEHVKNAQRINMHMATSGKGYKASDLVNTDRGVEKTGLCALADEIELKTEEVTVQLCHH